MPHLIHVRRVRGTWTGLYWLAFTEPAGLIERISKHYGDSQKVLRHPRQKLRDRLSAALCDAVRRGIRCALPA
jgi:hypothetical protein